MRRWMGRVAVLAVIALVIVGLRWTVFKPKPVAVSVVEVGRGRVESTVVNSRAGTVESRLRAQMSPGIAGLVAELPAKKGQRVRKGQVLLRLDDDEYQANHLLAERSLEASRSASKESCLAAQQAQRDLERAEGLRANDLVSTQDYEDAHTRAQTTTAECDAAQARIRQGEASVRAAAATLSKTVMTAPFDGVVLDVTTEVGEWISPSPPGVFIPPVLDVIDPDSLYVEAPIDEADVENMRVGLPARITLDAFKDRSFPGKVTYVASYVTTQQEQNRTLTVEAVFDEETLPANLLPGLSADLEIILDAHDDVLRIPSYALLEGDQVYVVEGERLKIVTVEVGLRNWEYVEVVSGLAEGDRVVTSLDRPHLQDGGRVRVEGDDGA